MAEIPKNLRSVLFPAGARLQARCAFVLWVLGIVCLVVGIIGSAINSTLGLGATNWILIAIALWVYSFCWWLPAYFAAKEG